MLAPLKFQHSAVHARPILFFHIPKTGGTSVKVAFQRLLGARHTVASYEEAMLPDIEYLVGRHARSVSPRIVLSHISPLRLTTGGGFLRTTVVRDPVDHLISFSATTSRGGTKGLRIWNSSEAARATVKGGSRGMTSIAVSKNSIVTIPKQGFSPVHLPGL